VRRGGRGSGGKAREMDFESFLDFVLALENRETPEGLTYLFKCLDLQNRGFLTTVDVHTLFRFVFIHQPRCHVNRLSKALHSACMAFIVWWHFLKCQ
jgi:Ca2+-binding EF-hand superfamily protein